MSSKSYDMTPRTMPDRDILAAMERDLRLYRAIRGARALTAEQVEQ